MKLVLMVAFYYPPMGGGGITRPLKFTKYLPCFGWQPLVLTARPDHYWFRDEQRLADIPPTAEVHRTRALTGIHALKKLWSKKQSEQSVQSRDAESMKRLRRLAAWIVFPDSFIGWLPFAVARGLSLCRTHRPDVIFATSPPPTVLLAGYLISRLSGIPLVTDYRDLWTEDMHFYPPTSLHRAAHRAAERLVLNHARSVTFINERMMNMMSGFSGREKKYAVIRSGYDPDDMSAIAPEIHSPQRPFKLIHTGNLTLNRPIGGLLQAVHELISEGAVSRDSIEIHFYGQRDDHNDRLIEQYPGIPVYSHDSVTHSESLRLQASADGLLFIGYDTNEKVGCVTTGKIYEYLYWNRFSGKPILALSAPCDATDLIERTEAGLISPMRDVPSIKSALFTIMKSRGSVSHGNKSDKDTFSIKHSAEQLADLFNRITG